MSDILTRIRVPGQKTFSGFQDWGSKTPEEIITIVRSYSEHLRAMASIIDETPDECFQIDLIRGSVVQHHIRELQKAEWRCLKCGARADESWDCCEVYKTAESDAQR